MRIGISVVFLVFMSMSLGDRREHEKPKKKDLAKILSVLKGGERAEHVLKLIRDYDYGLSEGRFIVCNGDNKNKFILLFREEKKGSGKGLLSGVVLFPNGEEDFKGGGQILVPLDMKGKLIGLNEAIMRYGDASMR